MCEICEVSGFNTPLISTIRDECNHLNLQIDPTSGDIRTSRDVDRETLCQRLDSTCKFDAEIISTPKQFFQLFKVEIFIDDLNDNSPVFPNPTITLDLAENAKVGTFLRLDSATDADTPKFGIVKYELDSKQDYFKLIQDNIDGSIIPQLELIKPLDYERKPTHTMQLVAVDGGNRQGSAEVIVRVVDVNDHSPVFATDRIECNIPEDLSIGDVVTILNATDGDYGENSRIVYSYQDTLVSEELQRMFKLDPNTGIIKIGEILDFEKQQQHILYIRAIDNGANAVPAYATVVINVLDVNDNRPEIKVSFIGDSENQQSVHYIQEDIAVGEFLAFVSVTDNDANEAGNELQTELEGSDDFELVTVDKKNNRYILQTRKMLDRERIETYDLTIRSVDNGKTQRQIGFFFTLLQYFFDLYRRLILTRFRKDQKYETPYSD